MASTGPKPQKLVDWEVIKGASHQNKHWQYFFVKTINRMAANQRQNQHFHMGIHCHQKEDLQHLYQCLQRWEWRKEFLGKMGQYCTNTNTPPTLKGTLMRGLTEYMDTDTSPTEHKAHPQNTMGWNLLLRRFIVKDFDHHYQKHSWHMTEATFFLTEGRRTFFVYCSCSNQSQNSQWPLASWWAILAVS